MSDEAKRALEQFLIALLRGLQDGASWAKEQVPLVLVEKLHFDMAMAIFYFALGFALLVASYAVGKRVWAWANRILAVDPVAGYAQPLILFPVGAGLFGLLMICSNLEKALQIYFAPRLYLLEWAMSLVKK